MRRNNVQEGRETVEKVRDEKEEEEDDKVEVTKSVSGMKQGQHLTVACGRKHHKTKRLKD